MTNLQVNLFNCGLEEVLHFAKDNNHRIETSAFFAALCQRHEDVHFFLSVRDHEVRLCLSWTKLEGYGIPLKRAGAFLDELEEFRIRDQEPIA